MIRHRPFGLGHPYRTEPDQRVPARPVEGGPIELRVTTDRAVEAVEAELRIDDDSRMERLEEFEPEKPPESESIGHLDAAAAGPGMRGRRGWRLILPPLAAGTRLAYRFRAGGKGTRWFSTSVGGWSGEGGQLRVDGHTGAGDRLIPSSVSWLRTDAGPFRLRFALRLEPDAHVAGFGERFDYLDQGGRRLDATVFEQYKSQGNRTYIPVPFAIVVPRAEASGWGFHVRTGHRTWFDVGAIEHDRLWVEVDLDPAETEPNVELTLYEGTPADVLRQFLADVGKPAIPPDWVFHPWMSGNEWNTQARVEAEVSRSQAEGIPVGVVVIEAWADEATFAVFRDARYEVHQDGSPHRLADFTFPPDGAWPDPAGLVKRLHDDGIRLLLWQVPLLPDRRRSNGQVAADWRTMTERGYAVREESGRPYRNRGWWFPGALMPDWTSPAGASWWLEKRRYLVEEMGVDGFKTDGGEHAWGAQLRYADGTRGASTNNLYPVLYERAYHQLMGLAGKEPVTFSRAGFTGAGSYPLHWAGDENSTWEAFRASITAGLTAATSGIFFWGWDLGGFSGEVPDAELYLRSAAMACLCPIMQYHSEFNHHRKPCRDRTPWNIAERTGDRRVISVYRSFARLREALVPYLAGQSRLAVDRSLPLMRPLFFEWPDDETAWSRPFEYLLGDALLIAPVVRPGVDRWEVYQPAGDWVDAWRGTEVAGPRTIEVPAPLDEIPVFIRAGTPEGLRDIFSTRRAGD